MTMPPVPCPLSPFFSVPFPCGTPSLKVSATEQHVELLKTIFDFSAIKALLAREDFSVLYDSMHGVQGPYAKVGARGRESERERVGNKCNDAPCARQNVGGVGVMAWKKCCKKNKWGGGIVRETAR